MNGQRMRFGLFAAAAAMVISLALTPLAGAQGEDEGHAVEVTDPDDAELRKEVGEAVAALRKYSVQKRDEALVEARAALDALDRAIEQREGSLRDDWSSMSESARNEASEALKALRARRQTLGEWYGALTHGASDAWDEIKAGFAAAYDDFQAAWQSDEPGGSEDGTE